MEEATPDHDAIIRLESKIEHLSIAIEAHNIASVERDTRIEEQVRRINGTVAKHTQELHDLTRRPELPNWLTADVVTRGVGEHQAVVREWPDMKMQVEHMWDTYRFGRWALGVLVIMQPLEIVVIAAIVHAWG